MVMLGPVEFDMSLLRYNLTDRKTLQSHKFNYFINQRVMFLTRNDSLKTVQYLSLINLIKPTTVYTVPHSHQSLNVFKSCLVKHSLIFFSL